MDTLQQTAAVRSEPTRNVIAVDLTVQKKQKSAFGFAEQVRGFEQARFGWMAIMLTLQSCVGAIACMMIQLNGGSVIALSVCAAVTMGSNAMFIALASGRVCLIAFYLSLAVNTAFILTNLP